VALLALAACSRRDAVGSAAAGDAPPPVAPKEAASATVLSGNVGLAEGGAGHAAAQPRALAGKKVLHVGDSMVGGKFGLTRALETRLAAAGAKLVRHTAVSETLQSFDRSPTLRDLLRTHDPDIVIVNLGTNDASVPFPQAYAHHVANIAKRIGDRECWWIGPPSWKGADTGIVDVLRDNAGSCRFFDSSKLELERTSDGIHPNDRGAGRWADAFWAVFAP
jgi:acyl-CoA thioesterase-1